MRPELLRDYFIKIFQLYVFLGTTIKIATTRGGVCFYLWGRGNRFLVFTEVAAVVRGICWYKKYYRFINPPNGRRTNQLLLSYTDIYIYI